MSADITGDVSVDVLVIGAGVAGLSVALGLAPNRSVLVIDGGPGSTALAQGGIASAFGDDEPSAHAADTIDAGAGACDTDTVRTLVEEGAHGLASLLRLGARFDRRADGHLATTLEGGHGRARVVHAGGDATGAEVATTLRRATRHIEKVSDTVDALTLAVSGQVTGAITRAGRHIKARAVVIATGGIGHAYLTSTNPREVRGDGIVLAARAGATLVDLEFVQFHPTALATGTPRGRLPLVTEALRGEGAVLRDRDGAPIMAGYGRRDLEPRDIVARAIDAVLERDGVRHVWLDATALGAPTLQNRFPTVLAECARIGIDPVSDPIPVTPAEHFLCGGIRVDGYGRTDVAGLYAVGETAASGVHGANRLASNSLLEGLVFGQRVATALTLDLPPHAEPLTDAPIGTDQDPDRVRTVLSHAAGIRRTGAGLSAAACELDELGDGPLATLARSVVVAAEARRESRGCHWRADHPHRSALGYRPIAVRLGPDGRPAARMLSQAS